MIVGFQVATTATIRTKNIFVESKTTIEGGPPGSRTRHQRIMHTRYGFRRHFRVWGLYSLYTFPFKGLRSGLPRSRTRGFPEFEQFYLCAASNERMARTFRQPLSQRSIAFD